MPIFLSTIRMHTEESLGFTLYLERIICRNARIFVEETQEQEDGLVAFSEDSKQWIAGNVKDAIYWFFMIMQRFCADTINPMIDASYDFSQSGLKRRICQIIAIYIVLVHQSEAMSL